MKSTLAFVFPGQGSQHIGMLSELASVYPQVIDMFGAVSDRLGYDLWKLVQQGPEDRLNQTEQTQAAMLTSDVAIYRILEQRLGCKPAMMAGHSLGEYAALVCANAISLVDAAELVSHRGRLMQEAVPLGLGSMAVIVGLPDDKIESICVTASTAQEQVTPANYNAIGQVVIAGHSSAVVRAMALAEDVGARMAKVIPVSVPCHCPLLTQAADRFEAYLQAVSFRSPELQVISNVDLSIYESPEQMRCLLKEQLYRPVRWVETIQLMSQKNIQHIIECGPGKVLNGLVKRIDNSLNPMSVYDSLSLDAVLAKIGLLPEQERLS